MPNLTGDFQYSIAQEDVDFITSIVQTTTPGENYYKVMVFVEQTRYITDPDALVPIGNSPYSLATVTKDSYMTVTSGLLLTWLADLFANNTSSQAYLVAFTANLADDSAWDATAVEAMKGAYDLTKTLAYWKTICVSTDQAVSAQPFCIPAYTDFVTYNNPDLGLLSAAVPLPLITQTPNDPTTDTLWQAIVTTGKLEAWFCAHQDPTRHGGLFSLGLALSVANMSGTPVGNSIDYVQTNLITASGAGGDALSTSVQTVLKSLNIQYFKPVGNGTGFVAAVGQKTVNGDYILANWIVRYCNYVNKIRTAELITTMNFQRNAVNYQKILALMTETVTRFEATGRLSGYTVSAPVFGALPSSAGDEYVIPNAWSAWFVDDVRKVRVYGQLNIRG